jgi:uncharacterized membrane protein
MPYGEIISTYLSENQQFLYTLLAQASFSLINESGWSLRLPAVLFGIGSLWALYLLGRQVGTTREALLSVALLAVSYHHIWFSQNARGYTGLLFWTILASWLLLRGLYDQRRRFWLFYAAAVALGVYTHMTMLFVIVGHFVIYLITILGRNRQEVRANPWAGVLLGFCLASLLIFQLHSLAIPQILGTISKTESVVVAWKNPLWTLFEFIKGVETGFAGSIVATGALLVFGAGVLSFARTQPVVIQLLVIPAVIGATVTVAMGHHLWPRFFFFAFGFGALVVVRGTMQYRTTREHWILLKHRSRQEMLLLL